MADALLQTQTNNWDNLLVNGTVPVVTESITLITGQNLARGSLIGKITASGKYTLSLTASSDGSEDPVAILAEDKDASAEDKTTVAYLSGQFNQGKITFGAAHTVASTKDALRDLNIYLREVVEEV